ncbi:1045_t:CDS:2, partial [Entrophospora sp. SA101]
MSKSLYSSVDSLGEASRRFVTLIATAGKVIQHIESIYENAQYNKRICNLFLDRVDVVPAYIKKLGRKQEENEHLFRNENYYKHFVRFTNVLCEIETFLKDITRLSGYSKYRNFKEMFEKLTRDIDNVMRNLEFKTTVAPEEQKRIDQRSLEEDYEEMEKFLESIHGGIVDDNKRMNTSLQEVLIIKNQVESKDKQDSNDSPIMATQISSTMLQDPMYKKSRGKENQIHKKVLNDDDDHKEVAFQPITIPDKVNKEMLKLQEEYSKIFMGAWEHDLTLRTSLQTIFLQLKSLSEKYGKRNPNTTFTKKESNPDGTIVRSKYSVSVSDSEEPLETKQINKPGSITQILPFGEGRNAHK